MDRREILALKPNVVLFRNRRKMYGNCPTLGGILLRRCFLTTIDAITYAIQVKQRYLSLKEYECMNPPTT